MLLGMLGNPWSLQDGRVEVDPDPEVQAELTPTRTRNEENGRRTYITEEDGV